MKPVILQMLAGLSHRIAGEGASRLTSDPDLLSRFIRERDDAAFTAILDRHGRLVWGVCRGLLPNDVDAEDVFQATFVALFRGAPKIRHAGSLAPWLHGTATRIAKKARLAAARRSRREHRAAKPEATASAVSEEAWEAVHIAVHDEIARLPIILRAAFVLCVLEGRRHEDAASQLGVPVGTLSARVSRARKTLLDRLSSRGLAPGVAAAAVACGTATIPAAVPELMLLHVREHLAKGFASVSNTIVDLATSVAGGASMKTKWLTAAVLAAGTLIATVGGMWFADAQEKGKPPADAIPVGGAPGKPEKSPVATEYPLGDVSRWLPQAESFHIRAECRYESGPEALAKNLREIKGQFPQETDPDPLVFTGLLPVMDVAVECAFDRSRIRVVAAWRTADNRNLSSDVRIWDGKRAILHEQYFHNHQNNVRLAPHPKRVVEADWFVGYLNKQPPVFWWNNTAEAKAEYEQRNGTPADFVLVGRETYHGVDCHVYLSAAGNQSDRFYVGVKDGRWYGAKEGIIAISPDLERKQQLAVEEFLGKKLGDRPSDSVWADVVNTLHSLPRGKKIAWGRLNYSRVAKDFIPVFEYWFSDFRDLGNGRIFPYREDFVFYDHEGQTKTYISHKRTLTIKEVIVDRPLDDRLFREPLTDGATIADDTHQPPLYYKHKAKFTPEEWQSIVKKAKDREVQETARRRNIDKLIGQPAPPLPAGEWLNSGPLTWADLRGKIVVLKFWAIGCAPCYGELSALTGPDGEDNPPDDSDKRASQNPIVFIGVHAPGNSKEEIEKVVKKHKLGAPICIDRKQAKTSWGEFFARCEVNAMPVSIAVDEEGRILAHGSFSDVMTAASQRRRKLAEKK